MMARSFKLFRNKLNEVINPRSEQDKAFFAVHATQKTDYPVDAEDQFTSDKGQARRPADRETHTMLERNVMKDLRDIVKRRSIKDITFDDGEQTTVDMMTANALTQVFDSVNTSNQRKMEKMLNKDLPSFMKMVDFAFRQASNARRR
jgi:hypothetical protein